MIKQLCFLLVLSISPAIAEEVPPIYLSADDTLALKAKEGQRVVVYGKSAHSGKSQRGMNFVNFAGAEFTLVTFTSDLVQFTKGEPADIYDDKRLAVEGVISIYKGKPQIKLTSPDQVTILNADEVFPPASTKTPKPAPSDKPAAKESPDAEPEDKNEPEDAPKPPVDPKDYFK